MCQSAKTVVTSYDSGSHDHFIRNFNWCLVVNRQITSPLLQHLQCFFSIFLATIDFQGLSLFIIELLCIILKFVYLHNINRKNLTDLTEKKFANKINNFDKPYQCKTKLSYSKLCYRIPLTYLWNFLLIPVAW